jgi:hypothetical protein
MQTCSIDTCHHKRIVKDGLCYTHWSEREHDRRLLRWALRRLEQLTNKSNPEAGSEAIEDDARASARR